MSCRAVRGDLERYLSGALPTSTAADTRHHLDHCESCWHSWNRLRWDRAADTPLYAELTEYLGDRFQPYYDSSRALADAWDHAAPHTTDDVHAFYRHTDAYLYNQVIWHASGNRPRYVDAALPLLEQHRGTRIIDYGCGIGADVLDLHHAGHEVIGCDLPSPPTDFFAWRAPRHHYPSPPWHPNDVTAADEPTIVWIIDTLDHLADFDATIGLLLPQAELVISENLAISRSHGRQRFHHRRPASQIDQWLAGHNLTRCPQPREPAALTVWKRNAPYLASRRRQPEPASVTQHRPTLAPRARATC